MPAQEDDNRASGSGEMSSGKVLTIALGFLAIVGGGATAGTYLIANGEISARLAQAESERDGAKKLLAASQQEIDDLKTVIATENNAAKVLPGWQAALSVCRQDLDGYKQNDKLLIDIQNLRIDKTSLDETLSGQYGSVLFGDNSIDERKLNDMRTRSAQYQEQILSLQSKLQCEGNAP